ncbi:MAG: hypothetical protein B6I20_06705 [Bacteroidetes bacterium 4572_117]|nr:MAG: hypothetical protein B6I20_06705 [Bacteroidetes bacterium 4572_117]
MLIAVILNIVASISNYFLGLHWSAIFVGLSGVIIFLFLYLYSFFAHKYNTVAILGLGFLIIMFIPSIWFTNLGSLGSAQYLIFLILTGILTITKGITKKALVVLLVIVTLSLFLFEYYYPETIAKYPGREERYLDLAISFVFTVLGAIFYISVYYNEYNAANKKLNEKNILLEKTHQAITVQQNKIEAQKTELEIKANDLQQANKTKDRFFTIIAHDLKNPFNALIGFSELIERAVENKDVEKIKNLNKYILKSSTQTHKLLVNLLEWSKTQTNQIQYKPEKIEIHKLIAEQIELFDNQASEKNIKLNIDSVNCNVFADINMVKTILRNLISNAIKYTKNGKIAIECTCNPLNCTVSISDTGIGISNEKLNQLFDVGNNISEPGTRLGLILCKEFIEKNNGEIFVESTVNQGSVFNFTLPLINKL